MAAIDHPPGSPVFEALKERIEALGYQIEVSERGTICRITWNRPTDYISNGRDPMPTGIIGLTLGYKVLVRIALHAVSELGDSVSIQDALARLDLFLMQSTRFALMLRASFAETSRIRPHAFYN